MSGHLARSPSRSLTVSRTFMGMEAKQVMLIRQYNFQRFTHAVFLVLLLAALLPCVQVSCARGISVRQQRRIRERFLAEELGNSTENQVLQKHDSFIQGVSGVNATDRDVYEESRRVVPSCPDPLHN
ncbi:hypothetical protein MLD38_007513 [Melastoma candidum]|uniref:Uncharacterized protein n=1 Tax=Melastoma candidum TaxID=119954 RepID=A0ACB9RSQ4_9MYRT|nr:hypothetical protein MLD38_007513 [Melastoma candidum]